MFLPSLQPSGTAPSQPQIAPSMQPFPAQGTFQQPLQPSQGVWGQMPMAPLQMPAGFQGSPWQLQPYPTVGGPTMMPGPGPDPSAYLSAGTGTLPKLNAGGQGAAAASMRLPNVYSGRGEGATVLTTDPNSVSRAFGAQQIVDVPKSRMQLYQKARQAGASPGYAALALGGGLDDYRLGDSGAYF